MNIKNTFIPGVMRVEGVPHTDSRGMFTRLYCENELSHILGSRRIVQINYSHTIDIGIIRGLHFQYPPHVEMKIVRCIKGRVWDVAVDLRANSPTLLHWYAEELSSTNFCMLVIPEGCAHGFQVLEPESELLYLHTNSYIQNSEAGLRYDDPRLDIKWPLPATYLSQRDNNHPFIDSNFAGIQV